MRPIPINDATLAFPANAVSDGLVPPWEDFPKDWLDTHTHTPWYQVAYHWFYNGVPKEVKFHLKEGIDGETMMRHLSAVSRSFAIAKHQHKMAAMTWLLEQWCHGIEWPQTQHTKAFTASHDS